MRFENEKTSIRKICMQNIRSLENAFVRSASSAFTRIVCDSEVFRNAGSVFVYISINKEPATDGIIRIAMESGKNVYVPKCLPDGNMAAVRIGRDTDFRSNTYSIPEPVEDTQQAEAGAIDLCVIPCIAATPAGGRIGHGGGYYDRFLDGVSTFKLCLCYEKNLLESLPVEPHDVIMDAIATEKRMVACK